MSGTRGCGNIFFHGCCLNCVYCQNWQISCADAVVPRAMSVDGLAAEMLRLQDLGAHTLGLVSPTSHLATIVPALRKVRATGLRIPVVYNTGGYDSLWALSLLDGLVDVYLPDMKYASNEAGRVFSGVAAYVDTNRLAVLEMFRQVGGLDVDEEGVAHRGLAIRHLVLPRGVADTEEVLQWVSRNLPLSVPFALMGQYEPSYQAAAGLFPELECRVSAEEYAYYVSVALETGIDNLVVQELDSASCYNPDFGRIEPFDGPA